MGQWQWLRRMPTMLAALRPEPAEHARRQLALQRNVLLPARLIMVAIVYFVLVYLLNRVIKHIESQVPEKR